MKQLLLLTFAAILVSCQQESSVEMLAKQHVDKATETWLDNKAKGREYSFTISNVETVFANDSLCVLSYNVATTSEGIEETTTLDYLIAKIKSGYKVLILHEKTDVVTPETFRRKVEAYKEEMKNDYTSEEIEAEIQSNIYSTIIKEGKIAEW